MAAVSATTCRVTVSTIPSSSPLRIPKFPAFRIHSHGHGRRISSSASSSSSCPNFSVVLKQSNKLLFPGRFTTKISSVAGEETLVAEDEGASDSIVEQVEAPSADQSVSVPVSPSDLLTMYFQADGTMSEAAIPTVTNALQGTEGVSDLRVQVLEGIATVELKKQTTVQATGVASNLVEIIQGSGFKLGTLNLSFEDENGS